ncbi:UNVERIFIED_CONTAM: hypothetical protein FKN15_057046 [Acipenser sinensis]
MLYNRDLRANRPLIDSHSPQLHLCSLSRTSGKTTRSDLAFNFSQLVLKNNTLVPPEIVDGVEPQTLSHKVQPPVLLSCTLQWGALCKQTSSLNPTTNNAACYLTLETVSYSFLSVCTSDAICKPSHDEQGFLVHQENLDPFPDRPVPACA